MRINPTTSGGRIIQGDTPYGRFRFEVDRDGSLVDYEFEMRTPEPPSGEVPGSDRPTLPIPADFDVETERRRTRQGGCCGKPSQ